MDKTVHTRSFNLDKDVLSLLHLRQKLGGADTEASLRDQLAWQNQTGEYLKYSWQFPTLFDLT